MCRSLLVVKLSDEELVETLDQSSSDYNVRLTGDGLDDDDLGCLKDGRIWAKFFGGLGD